MAAESDHILRVDRMFKSFSGIHALEDVTVDIPTGGIFGVIGPNGSGKTTLFNMVAGFYPPTSGTVVFKGQNITHLRSYQRSRIGIGRTFQIPHPFNELSVEENVMAGAITITNHLDEMRDIAQEHIKMVGLEQKKKSLAKELSTGQRKRLELAKAMASQPEMLLLDEITGGVDHPSIPGLIELVEKLNAMNVTIMMIEHNVRVITRLASRIMFLNVGRKVVEGPPSEVSSHPEVINLYLGDPV